MWIVQELVLAKKAVLLCGLDEVPWDAVKTRMRDGAFGILGSDAGQPVKQTEEGSVVAKITLPNTDYLYLTALQEKWRFKIWDQSLYNLLYTFRRFESSVPSDRIYAFQFEERACCPRT